MIPFKHPGEAPSYIEAKNLSAQGKWLEAAQVLERGASEQADWRYQAFFLDRAVAHYTQAKAWQDCVRCHRQLLSCIPEDEPSPIHLDAWCPIGLASGYGYLGLIEEPIDKLDLLGAAMTDQWSVYGRFVYQGAKMIVYEKAQLHEQVVEEGLAYVDWAERLTDSDEAFHRILPVIEEPLDPHLSCESGRGYCIVSVLTGFVLEAEFGLDWDTSSTFMRLERALDRYRDYCISHKASLATELEKDAFEEHQDWIDRRLGACYGKAGEVAVKIGEHARAISYYDAEEALAGSLYGHGHIYKAAALVAVGNKIEATKTLSKTKEVYTKNGRALEWWRDLTPFDPVRDEPTFTAIVENWS